MIAYICDLCKSIVLPDDIYFIEATKGNNRYSFDLCDRCYKKLFKDIRKRKAEEQEITLLGGFDDEGNL